MAKKVRRVKKRKAKAKQTPTVEPIIADGKAAKTNVVRGNIRDKRVTSEAQLRDEYAYVIKDLRRVFIIAAAMFALLILLNLLLQ